MKEVNRSDNSTDTIIFDILEKYDGYHSEKSLEAGISQEQIIIDLRAILTSESNVEKLMAMHNFFYQRFPSQPAIQQALQVASQTALSEMIFLSMEIENALQKIAKNKDKFWLEIILQRLKEPTVSNKELLSHLLYCLVKETWLVGLKSSLNILLSDELNRPYWVKKYIPQINSTCKEGTKWLDHNLQVLDVFKVTLAETNLKSKNITAYSLLNEFKRLLNTNLCSSPKEIFQKWEEFSKKNHDLQNPPSYFKRYTKYQKLWMLLTNYIKETEVVLSLPTILPRDMIVEIHSQLNTDDQWVVENSSKQFKETFKKFPQKKSITDFSSKTFSIKSAIVSNTRKFIVSIENQKIKVWNIWSRSVVLEVSTKLNDSRIENIIFSDKDKFVIIDYAKDTNDNKLCQHVVHAYDLSTKNLFELPVIESECNSFLLACSEYGQCLLQKNKNKLIVINFKAPHALKDPLLIRGELVQASIDNNNIFYASYITDSEGQNRLHMTQVKHREYEETRQDSAISDAIQFARKLSSNEMLCIGKNYRVDIYYEGFSIERCQLPRAFAGKVIYADVSSNRQYLAMVENYGTDLLLQQIVIININNQEVINIIKDTNCISAHFTPKGRLIMVEKDKVIIADPLTYHTPVKEVSVESAKTSNVNDDCRKNPENHPIKCLPG